MTNKQRLNTLRRAIARLRMTKDGYNPEGGHWKAALDLLHALEQDLAKSVRPLWLDIGPVEPGGPSLLDLSLTHETSGIPLFPAVDLAWGVGRPIIAPEDCVVDTKDTSADEGEAVYLTGRSKLRYWIGHLDRDWPLGTKLAKGALIGRVAPHSRAPHAHVGVNAEALLGKGKQLLYGRNGNGPNYTLGAPTIREQLVARQRR